MLNKNKTFIFIFLVSAVFGLFGFAINTKADIGKLDDRFGLFGYPDQIAGLGIPWGNFAGIYQEENNFIPQGLKTWFLLGQLGNGTTAAQATQYFGSLTSLENQYLTTSQGHDLYDRLGLFLNTTLSNDQFPSSQYPTVNNNQTSDMQVYVKTTFLWAAKLAAEHPGSYFAVGNEPDWLLMTSDEYAEYYNIFYTWIKMQDPTAKVMIGGLVGFLDESAYFNEANHLGQETTTADKYAWIRNFWNNYHTKFNTYPSVDVWNIHPYTLLTYPPGIVHHGPTNYTDITNKIIGFKNFLSTIGEGNKPLWATEIGVVALEGDISPNLEDEWGIVANNYMIPLLDWLKTSGYVDRWFWYGVFPYKDGWCNGNTPWTECLYKYPNQNGLYNPLGTVYKDSAYNWPLYNRDFETAGSLPFRWSFYTEAAQTGSAVTMDSGSHTGQRSAKIQISTTAGSAGYFNSIYQDMSNPSLAGKMIRLSAWTKTASSGQSGLIISLGYANGTVNGNWRTSLTPQASYTGWNQIFTPWMNIPQDVTWVRINGVGWGQGASVWFDDVNLEMATPPEVLAGDLNFDHTVNSLDWSYMNTKWFTNDGVADLNHDGYVNAIDFSIMNSHWFGTW